jgi:hypothetical protein
VTMRKVRCRCCDELIWCVVGPRWARSAVIRDTPCLGSERLNLPRPDPVEPHTVDLAVPTAPIPPYRAKSGPPDTDRGALRVEAGGAHRVRSSRFHRGDDGVGCGVADRLVSIG